MSKDPESYIGQPYELDEDKLAWKKAMGFPRGDKAHLPPPRLNENAMYYLTRAEGQLVRLMELFDKRETVDDTVFEGVRKVQEFLKSLRKSLDAS